MEIKVLTNIREIELAPWKHVLEQARTSTWFQSPEAYAFFLSQPNIFSPFVFAIPTRMYCVGYITKETNPIKHFFTRRAIIIGGPAIADNCSQEEVYVLLSTMRKELSSRSIYIECRNLNDYSPWQSAFQRAGFSYDLHNNFHIATKPFACESANSMQVVNGTMSNMRIRNIKSSFRDGVKVISSPTLEQVREFYSILLHLYRTKVKTPLFPWSFFETLYAHPDSRFILVADSTRILGGTICMAQTGKCLYEWFIAGIDGEISSVYPSSVATYAAIRYAAENNLPRFDMMGAGSPKEQYGVRDFKAEFGGQLLEHGRYKFICQPCLYRIGVLGLSILKRF